MVRSVFLRLRSASLPAGRELTASERHEVPRRFEAVAEALVARRSPSEACAVVGAALAADGVAMPEALSMLAATYRCVGLGDPDFSATDALCVAWSEETLAFLGDVSCEDPLTGLASTPHLRARVCEVYREAEVAGTSPRTTHGLVVVDLARAMRVSGRDPDAFERALLLAAVAETTADHLPGGTTMARVGTDKIAVLVRREPDLGRHLGELRASLQETGLAPRARIWIEGLPDSGDGAVMMLSGLPLL